MDHEAFDKALIASAFELAAARGWANVTVADAARAAELPLPEARTRFPGRGAILLRVGRMADEAALTGIESSDDGSTRDRLFGMVMRRLDVFQLHRAGVLALFKALPADPLAAVMLWGATLRSMGWLLDGAGISPVGLDRAVRAHGLVVVWLAVIRAWTKDETEDLSATMAVLDRALDRAEQMSGWMGGKRPAEPEGAPLHDEPIGETAPAVDAGALPTTTPPPLSEPPSSPPV